MKKISSIIAAVTVLFFSSCNNSGNDKEETKSADTTTIANAPEPKAFTPFTVLTIQHTLKSFDKWLPLYQAHDSVRKAHGLTEISMGRGLDNPNEIYLAFKADDVAKAKEFAAMPDLKEVMQKAGVTGPPTIDYLNVIRSDTSAIDQKERVRVVHHVKDFDTWLKGYDAEGKEARAANGLIDRGLARGVDDPNMVYILFAVTDMTKAKARMNSPELKKIMTDAGVDAPPTISFFKLVK